jgi:hypothetical protein
LIKIYSQLNLKQRFQLAALKKAVFTILLLPLRQAYINQSLSASLTATKLPKESIILQWHKAKVNFRSSQINFILLNNTNKLITDPGKSLKFKTPLHVFMNNFKTSFLSVALTTKICILLII